MLCELLSRGWEMVSSNDKKFVFRKEREKDKSGEVAEDEINAFFVGENDMKSEFTE